MTEAHHTRREQWDEIPAKVIGRKAKQPMNLERGAAFLRMSAERGTPCVSWPKGVYRFKTHEEADKWRLENMRTR